MANVANFCEGCRITLYSGEEVLWCANERCQHTSLRRPIEGTPLYKEWVASHTKQRHERD